MAGYMALMKVHWSILTSHEKWIVFRLEPGSMGACFTFSDTLSSENSDVLLAFVAVLWVVDKGYEVPSQPSEAPAKALEYTAESSKIIDAAGNKSSERTVAQTRSETNNSLMVCPSHF